MITGLPKTLEVGGVEYPIRWDFRAALDIFEAISDPEAGPQERSYYLLYILYEDFEAIPSEQWEEAVQRGIWFLNGGTDPSEQPGPRLMDWEQDYPLIIPAVNRVAGTEVRDLMALHWWTFLGYYQEIGGDCAFAQVVSIRAKLHKGKKLEKHEREFYEKNRHLVDLKNRITADEEDFLATLVKRER